MPDTPLAKRLVIKPHYRILLMNAPEGYRAQLSELSEGVTVVTEGDGSFDMVQAFAEQRAELEKIAPRAIQAVKPDGLLWLRIRRRRARLRRIFRER